MTKDKWRLILNLFTAFSLTALGILGSSPEYHRDVWPLYLAAGIIWFGYIVMEWGR